MIRNCLFMFLIACLTMSAMANEQILISGGPALGYNERGKEARHDKFWGNFIGAAVLRFKTIKSEDPHDSITWMVYQPSYVSRGNEDKEDYVKQIEQDAQNAGVKLVWFQNRDEFVNYLKSNRTAGNKISRFEYFGHSNKRDWMFDYSNLLDGGAPEYAMFHMWHFKELSHDLFTDDAFCQSWGCHSGEEYSGAWYKRIGVRMKGAIGKTDYSNGGLPFLSSANGRWSQ